MLKRWRLTRLKLELEKIKAHNRAIREGQTTRAMVAEMDKATVAIITLENKIRELEGDEVEDSGDFDDRLPSGIYCPVKKE